MQLSYVHMKIIIWFILLTVQVYILKLFSYYNYINSIVYNYTNIFFNKILNFQLIS
jgi:hypothetical protein